MNPIFTIGHSTRNIKDFIMLLRKFRITKVCDVRSVPKSLHNPQFNQTELRKTLRNRRIKYQYFKGLGGFRPLAKNDINAGWINKSFKGYADYMQTPEFEENLDKLIKSCQNDICVIMCAEALPWRCHRSLIADALTIRGYEVHNIINDKKADIHIVTSFAKVEDTHITYPIQN